MAENPNGVGQHGSDHYVPVAAPPPEAEEEHPENDGAVAAAGRHDHAPRPPDHGEVHVCDTCGAVYPTEKAMFGHLRCHKERGWRGAYCPPSFSMDEFAEYREHLVKSEEEQLREIEGEESVRRRVRLQGAVAPAPPRRPYREVVGPPPLVGRNGAGGLGLDLNAPPEEEEEEGRHNRIDLNLPPSDEE